ncbi:MAG: radical SAM protein [Lachnospiraceae bacterium]|nr:radical SAM protein [Lachnospiraceae bacterium]
MAMMDKPRVVEKVRKFVKAQKKNGNKVGTIPRAITLNYNNICNFNCEFCFSAEKGNAHLKDCLDFDTIKNLADQADEIGIWEIVLTGGELLVAPDKLYKLIDAFGAERFQMIIISNGYLMTEDMAKKLAEKGIDCVGISLSGMDEEKHNKERGGVKDAHKRALEALDYVNAAGMAAWPNLIFGHHNSKDPDLYACLDYAKSKGYTTYFMMAMPFGAWKDNIMDAEDMRILADIRKKYDCCFDTWDMYDTKRERVSGCWTVNRTYITPLGDVLVCPYINIKIGNIKEQPLKDILDYGFSIKYFGEYSPICLSAHNLSFRKKYLPDSGNIFSPLDAHEIFDEGDYRKDVNE